MAITLTLTPIPFYWPKSTVAQFYENAQSWPIDTVILGETVCSKRRELNLSDWLNIAEQLIKSGKKIRLSTLALIESAAEFNAIKQLCSHAVELEANDLGAVALFQQNNQRFTGGHFFNIYNFETLALLHKDGLTSWTLPIELGQHDLANFLTAIHKNKLKIHTEVFAHGYLPLALSARCFTARALDKPKDKCEKICINYPEGIAVNSQDGKKLFTLNGIQTLSGDVIDLLAYVPAIKSLGVDSLRLSPSRFDMEKIIINYRLAIEGKCTEQPDYHYCNGYWHGGDGIKQQPDAFNTLAQH